MNKEIIGESVAKWVFLAVLAVIDAVWIGLSDFHFVLRPLIGLVPLLLIPTVAAWASLLWRKNRGLYVLFDTMAQIFAFAAVGQVLIYLLLSTDLPARDATMSAIDFAIGVDWPRYVAWIQAHPAFDLALDIAYISWVLEWFGALVVLAYRSEERVREMWGCILISSAIMFVMMMLLPAISAFPFYGPAHPELVIPPDLLFHDIGALRDGSLRVIDLPKTDGLVTLPSFHSIVALLLAYSMRGRRILFPVAIVWSVLVMISTLSAGGHYVVDSIAAALVTIVAAVAYRRAITLVASR